MLQKKSKQPVRRRPRCTSTAHRFSADKPIESANEDLLGRRSFAASLAASIRGWDAQQSLVIALQGAWGSGKTSVKNMMLEHLAKSDKRSRPGVIQFCPWQLSPTGNLTGRFFQELGILLGTAGEKGKRSQRALSAYSKVLNLAAVTTSAVGGAVTVVSPKVGGVLVGVGGGINLAAKALEAGAQASDAAEKTKTKSLAETKKALSESMAALTRPIVVVIDDIDRLTTTEILELLQLVKVNADFPNLIYLLLFERSVVEKALDPVSGGNGHEYLQKIVQVELHVPRPHRHSIERVLFSGLNDLVKDQAISTLFNQDRWNSLYSTGLDRFFQNLRHVYRFLGSLAFHLAQFRTEQSFEVNPVDLIGLEALRVFEPALYEQIPFAKNILARDEAGVLFNRITAEEIQAVVGQLFEHVPQDRHAQIKPIMTLLFPPIVQPLGRDYAVARNLEQWDRERRACHAAYFDRYFALVIREGDLSQAMLDRLLNLSGDRHGFVAECRALMHQNLLALTFERLDAYKEEVPLAHMPALICALSDLSDSFPEERLRTNLFNFDLNARAWRLVYFGLGRQQDHAQRFSILKEAFGNSSGLALPVTIVQHDERGGDREASGHQFLVDAAELEQLKGICAAKIRDAAKSPEFPKTPRLQTYLWKWLEWGNQDEVRAWVSEKTQNAVGVLWLLRTFLRETSVVGPVGSTVHRHVDLEVIQKFADLDRITTLTSTLRPDTLAGLDRTALVQYRKALKRKEENRPGDWGPEADVSV